MKKNKRPLPPNSKLRDTLKKGENDKVEFKQNVDTSLSKEMVAFANSVGGQIYIGVTDKSEVTGIEITNKLKSQIENIAHSCDPPVLISLQEMKKEKILVVNVEESKDKPHKCSSGFYIRSGTSSQKLSRDELRAFMEEEELIRFDTVACRKFIYKKHFDKKKLFFFLDKAEMKYSQRNYVQLLENLEVAKRNKSRIIFTNAGALFFSKHLERIFLHTDISCALFKGKEKIHVIDRKQFNEDLIANIENSVKFLEKNLRLEYRLPKGQLRRDEVLEIPVEALREALVNAVTHRDYLNEGSSITVEIYDDRVEISSPGGLPKRLEKKDFGKISICRNPLIAHLMLRAKYIEKMGTGIAKMRFLVKKAGLLPIKFEFGKFMTVTFFRKPLLGNDSFILPAKADEKLSKRLCDELDIKGERANRLLQILSHIEKEIFSKLSFSENYNVVSRTLERDITLLKDHRLISFEGSPKTGKYRITKKYRKLKNPKGK